MFGSCCFLQDDHMTNMSVKSIKIEGIQLSFLVNFEVEQIFYHSEKEAKEVSYVFPNDHKICIYSITFVVGDEIIKPKLQSKEEAEKIYNEAVNSGHTAVYGTNIGNGMTQLKIGNIHPEIECKIILKLAFTGQITKERTFFIKFPIDIYTPSGSVGCLDLNNSEFSFKLQCDSEKVTKVSSNVKNSKYDEVTKLFSISDNIENKDNEKSIIITFETTEKIESSCLLSPTNLVNFDGCAVLIAPNLPPSSITYNDFIFVVDCSGSMKFGSIKKASECLSFFIKSLPTESYFNIIRFGTTFEKLFDISVLNDDSTSEIAINLANNLEANLGGTNIFSPLENIFSEKVSHGQRQIFVMTDGQVSNAEKVLELVSNNSNDNRCFTIGIGSGCDAGLVEGIANSSGGMSDFVQEGDSISEKVIPQLQSSLHPSVTNIEIHIEGENNDSFEMSPFPLPSINARGSSVVFLRQKKKLIKNESFANGILITANYGNESIEIPIVDVRRLINIEEDNCGRSSGKNIGNAILPLFTFATIQKVERRKYISDDDKAKLINLSISSGVLCKYTSFVGTSVKKIETISDIQMQMIEYMREQRIPRKSGRKESDSCSKNDVKTTNINEYIKEIRKRKIEPEKKQKEKEKEKNIMKSQHEKIMAGGEYMEKLRREKRKNQSNKLELISLIQLQKVTGFWNDLNAVKNLTGIKIDKIDEINLSDKQIENYIIATILAIVAMRVKFSNEKISWSMIEQKAIDWLNKTLPDVDIEKVISKIESTI